MGRKREKQSRRKTRTARVTRQLSEFEESFLEEVDLYDRVITVTVLISQHQHGIDADGRGLRATKIFTRQTVVALSLRRILPRPSPTRHEEAELWDVVSLASLTRNLIEGYLGLYYFGTETVSPGEAELRFFLLQLHRNVEWYEIRKAGAADDLGLKEFEEGIPKQRDRIREHPFLPKLTEAQRNRALRGHEMYKTKADFEAEIEECKDLRKHFRHLSNLVHPLPLSIERIDNERGRGIGSEADVNYCLICLILARRFLAATTVAIADHFPEQLASKFEGPLGTIRPLITAGFEA